MKMILMAATTIFWVSMMNKLYYGCLFWYVAILFSSNKLLKLKYIHHYFFSKISNEKIMVRLMGREIRLLHMASFKCTLILSEDMVNKVKLIYT